MIKFLIKLLVVALAANALWRVGSAYRSFYQFQDGVYAAAMETKQDDELRARIDDLASTYGVPLTGNGVSLRRDDSHTIVEASYTKRLAVLPGYEYPWPFSLSVDAYRVSAVKLRDLANPNPP